MKILIACEFSGRVRDAFIARGHDAVSCDLLPTDSPGPHIQGEVELILEDGWDMMIAFPPCTYLCSSGLHWNKRVSGREEKTHEAMLFVFTLIDAPIPKIGLENPIGCISTNYRKPDQIIQPWMFGEDASKATCLWLKDLPELKETQRVPGRVVGEDKKGMSIVRWGNQCDSGQNKLGPSEDRGKIRATTYQGIADAMADQWGKENNRVPSVLF